jgi:hypothetical protein
MNTGGTILSIPFGIRALVVAMAMFGTFAAPSVAQETGQLSTLRQEALSLVNTARAEVDLPELQPSDVLDQAAQGHAVDMLQREYHDHVSRSIFRAECLRCGPCGRSHHPRIILRPCSTSVPEGSLPTFAQGLSNPRKRPELSFVQH